MKLKTHHTFTYSIIGVPQQGGLSKEVVVVVVVVAVVVLTLTRIIKSVVAGHIPIKAVKTACRNWETALTQKAPPPPIKRR